MVEYRIIEDEWPEIDNQVFDDSWKAKNVPVAITREKAFLFRNSEGKIIHKYCIPEYHQILRHYLNYASYDSADDLPIHVMKSHLLNYVKACILKLSAVRKTITILEIGSAIGENFLLIKKMASELSPSIKIKFVGVEINQDLCQFSYLATQNDPDYHVVCGDASDLSRFPDKCFDIVINQGVASITHDQELAFSEIVRVARICVVSGMYISKMPDSIHLTHGSSGYVYLIPTFEKIVDIWKKYAPIYDYKMKEIDAIEVESSGSGSDIFIGVKSSEIKAGFEYHIIARQPIFKEMNELCQLIR